MTRASIDPRKDCKRDARGFHAPFDQQRLRRSRPQPSPKPRRRPDLRVSAGTPARNCHDQFSRAVGPKKNGEDARVIADTE
jgi:hypothetical protein